jgi:hypothetical protein
MRLLTAKLPSRDLSALKKSMLRPGFVAEWNNLDSLAAGFAKALLAKQNAKPSASFKLFMSYDPEAILWLCFTSKEKAVQERFNLFLRVWPESRQRIPHAMMQELRITPDLPSYSELVQSIFLELIDGHVTTPEEMRAYLEPHSPPAPPPQATIKRPRVRREAKLKEPAFEEEEEAEEDLAGDEELEPIVADEDELDLAVVLPKGVLAVDMDLEGEEEEEELEKEGAEAVPAIKKQTAAPATAKKAQKPAPAAKPAPAEPVAPAAPPKPAPAKTQPAAATKPAPKAVAAKPAKPEKPAKPAAKGPAPIKANAPAREPAKAAAKAPAKKAAKPAPAKAARPKPKPARAAAAKPAKKAPKKYSKPAAKKSVSKPAKKR